MTLTVLLSVKPNLWDDFNTALPPAFAAAGLDATLVDTADPATVDYIVYAPNDQLTDFTPYSNAKAVLSVFAGVERIVGNDTLTQPLCRMVDPALCEGMVEWVTAQVLRHHLWLDRNHQRTAWVQEAPPLARNRRVTMLGLGELGLACARTLTTLNFQVTGWSRSAKEVEFPAFHGDDGLTHALEGAEIVVLLLPDTAATRDILNERTLSGLAKGAVIVNPGRGSLIDDEALLAALESGQVGHATLDVFRVEPLPADHPYWVHPEVTISPHIAAVSRPDTASGVVAENIRRAEAGEPLLHLVDRARGY